MKINPLSFAIKIALVFAIIVTSIFSFYIYSVEKDSIFNQVVDDHNRISILAENLVDQRFTFMASELLVTSKQYAFTEYFEGDESALEDLRIELLSLANIESDYDQIRVLDPEGNEIVRINNEEPPVIIEDNELQYKGDRYYFAESLSKGYEELFMSPLDLNIEGDEIETPFKPMVRLGTPLIHNGEKKGVLLFNYRGRNFLQQVEDFSSSSISVEMVNSDGYWLKSQSEEKEWGFMLEDVGDKFQDEYSALWSEFENSDKTMQTEQIGDELITLKKVYPSQAANRVSSSFINKDSSISNDGEVWVLVFRTSLDSIYGDVNNLRNNLIAINALVVTLIIILVIVIEVFIRRDQKSKVKISKLNNILLIMNKTLRHDLANQLTISRYSLEGMENIPEKYRKDLEEIGAATLKGIEIIGEMKQLEQSVSKSNENQVLNVAEVLEGMKGDYDCTLEIHGKVFVKADIALKTVLHNLITNAMTHGSADKIVIRMSEAGKDEVVIEVQDNGSGIPRQVREKIFDEGFTYGDKGNTGLGLYISKETISRFGGKIYVKETPEGSGATFIIKLKRGRENNSLHTEDL